MASEKDIIRAEAIHMLLMLVEERHKEFGEDCIIFMTADVVECFFKNIQFSKKFKVQSLSFGMPLDDIKLKAGMSGCINHIKLHIIEGTNKVYGGTLLDIDKVIGIARESENEFS